MAFATTTDIVALFLGIIVTAIAKMLLNAADIIVTPLLAITSMTTQEIEAYIPGLNNSDPNGVGNFFSSAISIIAYTIAGVLLCCHIISYLIALANDERLESIPKLIWNGMFGIVLTIAGKNLLSLLFNEIIAPLSEALVDGMQSAGGMSFTFEGKANDIISLGDGISAFDLSALGTLLVVLAMLLLIWWNLIKLILECAQRYIICIVTINLSPLAFATATTEQTKQTAVNWLKMFWSQCVLLVLNIWVVGIARTALNNGMIGGSSTELVTWALITYAFLKIAQQLDDMMAKAGLKVTSMSGLDPFSEAQGVMRNLTGIGAAVNTALGYGKGALDTWRSDKASGDGKNPTLTEADLNRAEADFDKTDAQRKTGLDKGSINTASYNDDAHKKAMENVLKTEGALKEGEQVEGVKIGEDGALNATAVKRDERGRITSSREIKATNTGDGLGLTPAESPTSSLKVGNGGKSVIVANEKGTFKLESQGKNEEGENVWKATQLTDANGNKISDVAPKTDAKQDVGEAASQVQAEAVTQQSSEQAETVSIPSVPQGIVLSNTSVNKLSDTNGTIRSASAGVFQLTREGLDEDTGKTVWRATLKQDAEGNPVTDYSANTFTFERTAKWNAQTRSYQPEGFDSVAKEVREAVDFRDISQSANQSRGSRRSDKPQNPPEHERFKRERNPRAYTDDARLTEGRRTTSTSRGGKHRAQRKSDTAKKRDNPLKNMDGFKTKR